MTIVAVHGNGGGAFRFARVGPCVPADIRFRAVTLPGFAGTPANPALRSIADYASYLSEVLASEARPVVLLGHGGGGSIALQLAQRHAALIDGLILHAPVGARLGRRLFPRLMRLPGVRPAGRWLFSARGARPLFQRLLFSPAVPAADARRFFEEYRRCAVFGQMYDLLTPAWFGALRPVAVPSALLWGGSERLLRASHVRDFRTLLPGCAIRVVPGWGHFPMLEQPEAYAREVVALARALVRG